jgi:glycosyltransferase involved in cell wall biosynthesis
MDLASRAEPRRIRFLGAVAHSGLAALYQRATLAVFPFAEQEGFGLVVVEAMGCGCPVIASDIPSLRESTNCGTTGLLVPRKDPEALADAIERCLIDPHLRSELARSALESVRARFDWPSAASKYCEAIRACVE